MSKPASAKKSGIQPGEPVQIAVVGGGPKAAAIAAKAWVLQEQNKADVRVTIFEPDRIGANWSGKAGYTDGEQRLCTIAERDVGYPYNRTIDLDVDVAMSSRFSWTRFLHTRPLGYQTGYSTWVDAGRKPPLHKHFAAYLKWVIREASSQVTVVRQSVAGLSANGSYWNVEAANRKGELSMYATQFDAIVVTGPGPAKKIAANSPTAYSASQKIFNGRDFWQRLKEVRRSLRTAIKESRYSENAIVIVGAGGTAAAIFAWLVTNGAGNLPIYMVAGQASLYTRVDSVFENQLFSDDTQWKTLSPASRRAFFDRLNRGVVWESVIDRVSSASKFQMVDGRAKQIVISGTGDVRLEVLRGDGVDVTLEASILIDCSGFDAWWFLSLIKGFPTVATTDEAARRAAWQQGMIGNLQLQGDAWDVYPPLHAPMLSGELGPGFGSLMVLGAMADRILRPYLSATKGRTPP